MAEQMRTSEGFPAVVSREEWQRERDALLKKEKAHTRAQDALAAERRRLPVVRVERSYLFDGAAGKASLLDLFDGRRQLIVYHFMFAPPVDGIAATDGWPDSGCPGCSMFVDNLPHLAHLHARDTSLCLISRGPRANLDRYRVRMGWRVPWYSSGATTFNRDFGITTAAGETHGLSVFLRDGEEIFHAYFTNARGCESSSLWNLLDYTPFGRQESWEDAQSGWPRSEPYAWWRRHDEYEDA